MRREVIAAGIVMVVGINEATAVLAGTPDNAGIPASPSKEVGVPSISSV